MVPKNVSFLLLPKQLVGDVWIAQLDWLSSINEVQRLQTFCHHSCCMFVV